MRVREFKTSDAPALQSMASAQKERWFSFLPHNDFLVALPDMPCTAIVLVMEDENGKTVAAATARAVYEIDVHLDPDTPRQAQKFMALEKVIRRKLRGISRNLYRMGLVAPTEMICQTSRDLTREHKLLDLIGFEKVHRMLSWFRMDL